MLLMHFSGASGAENNVTASLHSRLIDPRPLVIAHRGCWRDTAENSIAGISQCAQLGVDLVEVDLRVTQDGVVVLLHDDTLERTTSLRGQLRNHTYAEVRHARLRGGQGGSQAPLTQHKLPTFEQVLETPLGQTFIFLDIKEAIHESVYRLIQKHNAQARVLFSVNKEFGDTFLRSGLPRQVAVMPKFDQYEDGRCDENADPSATFAKYASLDALMYEAVFCDDGFLSRALALTRPKKLWVNTLGPQFAANRNEAEALHDPDKVWGDLLRRGVGAIQTDYPRELIAYLKDHEHSMPE